MFINRFIHLIFIRETSLLNTSHNVWYAPLFQVINFLLILIFIQFICL
jgi:hypothetical protein